MATGERKGNAPQVETRRTVRRRKENGRPGAAKEISKKRTSGGSRLSVPNASSSVNGSSPRSLPGCRGNRRSGRAVPGSGQGSASGLPSASSSARGPPQNTDEEIQEKIMVIMKQNPGAIDAFLSISASPRMDLNGESEKSGEEGANEEDDLEDDAEDEAAEDEDYEELENMQREAVANGGGESDEEMELEIDDQFSGRGRTQCMPRGTTDPHVNSRDRVARDAEMDSLHQDWQCVDAPLEDDRSRHKELNDNACDVDSRDGVQEERNLLAPVGLNRSVDLSVVTNLMCKCRDEIMQSMNEAITELKKEREKDRVLIHRLEDQIKDLITITSTTANAMMLKNANKINDRQAEINRILCVIPFLFTDHLISVIQAKIFSRFCAKEIGTSNVDPLGRVGLLFIQVMLFSRQPGETRKEKFHNELGVMYCKFRHGVLLSSIKALQDNAFGSFDIDTKNSSNSPGSIDSGRLKRGSAHAKDQKALQKKVKQPKWLNPGYILRKHCDSAAEKMHDLGSKENSANTSSESSAEENQASGLDDTSNTNSVKSKSSKAGAITRDVIASEAASMVYRIITNVLHKARDACRIQIFHDLFYVFSTWKQFKVRIDQKTLKLSWYDDVCAVSGLQRITPSVTEVRVQDRLFGNSEVAEASRQNCPILTDFMTVHPEMSLVVEHGVMVKGKTRTLRYFVNLVEVVCKMLAAFSSLESNCTAEDFLSVDRDSLNVVMFIATGLRRIICETMSCVTEDGFVAWLAKKKPNKTDKEAHVHVDENNGEFRFPQVNGLSIDNFMPAWTRQRNHLGSMLLTLKQPEYDMKHRDLDRAAHRATASMGLTDEAEDFNDEIQPDETLGVIEF